MRSPEYLAEVKDEACELVEEVIRCESLQEKIVIEQRPNGGGQTRSVRIVHHPRRLEIEANYGPGEGGLILSSVALKLIHTGSRKPIVIIRTDNSPASMATITPDHFEKPVSAMRAVFEGWKDSKTTS